MRNERYVNITIDFGEFAKKRVDVRVPINISVKEMLKIVVDAYQLSLTIVNPTVRNQQFGTVMSGLDYIRDVEFMRNGIVLQLESL